MDQTLASNTDLYSVKAKSNWITVIRAKPHQTAKLIDNKQ